MKSYEKAPFSNIKLLPYAIHNYLRTNYIYKVVSGINFHSYVLCLSKSDDTDG